jgi:predicted RNA-binding protein YlqC (UPF0109 family)
MKPIHTIVSIAIAGLAVALGYHFIASTSLDQRVERQGTKLEEVSRRADDQGKVVARQGEALEATRQEVSDHGGRLEAVEKKVVEAAPPPAALAKDTAQREAPATQCAPPLSGLVTRPSSHAQSYTERTHPRHVYASASSPSPDSVRASTPRSPTPLGLPSGSLDPNEEHTVTVPIDLSVDFMDMTDDRHLVTRVIDARPCYVPVVGSYAVVGDDDADPMVARILSIDADGIIDLQVLPGSVEAHRHVLAPA